MSKDIKKEGLVSQFKPASEAENLTDIASLDGAEKERLKKSGIELSSAGRVGTFLQANCGVTKCECGIKGVELLPITEAAQKI